MFWQADGELRLRVVLIEADVREIDSRPPDQLVVGVLVN